MQKASLTFKHDFDTERFSEVVKKIYGVSKTATDEGEAALAVHVDGKVRSELFGDTFMYNPANFVFMKFSSKSR